MEGGCWGIVGVIEGKVEPRRLESEMVSSGETGERRVEIFLGVKCQE